MQQLQQQQQQQLAHYINPPNLSPKCSHKPLTSVPTYPTLFDKGTFTEDLPETPDIMLHQQSHIPIRPSMFISPTLERKYGPWLRLSDPPPTSVPNLPPECPENLSQTQEEALLLEADMCVKEVEGAQGQESPYRQEKACGGDGGGGASLHWSKRSLAHVSTRAWDDNAATSRHLPLNPGVPSLNLAT
ncbi:hypothetical protein INR49_024001 [Caranx melampygus]|nr:hypothetical protein INR49_024001 [Caranx melampygus]